jgi:hypothetical protein
MQMAFLASARSAIFFHCSSVGSTPEGLWATLSTACSCQNRVVCLPCVRILLPALLLLRCVAYTSGTLPCLHMSPSARGHIGARETHDKTCYKTRTCGGRRRSPPWPCRGPRAWRRDRDPSSVAKGPMSPHQSIPQSARLLHTRAATARQDSGSVHYGKDSAPLRQRLWQCGTRAQRSKKQSLAARPEENMFYIEHVYHPSDRAPSAHDNSMPRVHPRGRC